MEKKLQFEYKKIPKLFERNNSGKRLGEIIPRNITSHILSHRCLSAELRFCGNTITTVLAGNAVIQIVSAADSSGYRCSFCTGEQRRVGTNGNLLPLGELAAIGVDRISVGIKYRLSDLASFLRILQRRVRTQLRLRICPRLSHSVKLLCRRCRNSGSSCIQIRLYLFLELCPMWQDVRWTHLVPIVHGVQLVNRSVSSVTNIEPMGMGVEVADVQSILFQ